MPEQRSYTDKLTGPLLHYAGEKWKTGAAFGGAILVHAAAVLLAGIYSYAPIGAVLELAQGSVEVMFEPVTPEESLAPEIEIPPPPNPDELQFLEERIPPPVRREPSKPIAKARAGTPGSTTATEARSMIVSAPWPDYPADARERKETGHGVVVMTVNPLTGNVTHVSMSKSTGSSSLDHAAIRGFRRWRFRPGSVSKVRSPVTFALNGASN